MSGNNKLARLPVVVLLMLLLVGFASFAVQARPTVAVVDFQINIRDTNPKLVQICEDLLSVSLVNTEEFTVVERSRLADIIEEQKLSLTGLMDSRELRTQVGKLLGADYLATGAITSFDVHTETFRGYGVTTTQLVASLSGVLQIIDVTTGAIEVALPFTSEHEENISANQRINRGNYVSPLLEKALSKAMPRIVEHFGRGFSNSTESIYAIDIATVYVYSDPGGARVYVNHRLYGRTPIEIDLSKGTYTFEVVHSDYRAWARELTIFDGLRINATLGY